MAFVGGLSLGVAIGIAVMARIRAGIDLRRQEDLRRAERYYRGGHA